MPASMFSIDNILAARPRCKDSVLPVAPSAAAPVVFPALHGDSLYGAGGGASSDYGAFYPRPVAPGGAGLPAAVGSSRLGYNNYFYGQLHVQAAPVGPACCGAVPPLGAQQCSCVPTPPGRVALAPAFAACRGRQLLGRRRVAALAFFFTSQKLFSFCKSASHPPLIFFCGSGAGVCTLGCKLYASWRKMYPCLHRETGRRDSLTGGRSATLLHVLVPSICAHLQFPALPCRRV